MREDLGPGTLGTLPSIARATRAPRHLQAPLTTIRRLFTHPTLPGWPQMPDGLVRFQWLERVDAAPLAAPPEPEINFILFPGEATL